MTHVSVWLHSARAEQESGPLAERLRAGGIGVRAWSGRAEPTPGVLLLDEVTPAALELVTESSDHGRCVVWVIVDEQKPAAPRHPEDWQLLAAGAADALRGGDLNGIAASLLARLSRWREIEQLQTDAPVRSCCVGSSEPWTSVMRRITEAAIFGDAPVLLSGESGTGKEVVAQLIHQLDRRPDKGAFITVDCTTIAKELAGSELFGHIRGAFTGAHHDREGAFALADGGTLFLDEIGDLPLPLQAELLRVLQERTFKAVGANVWRRTRFRLIAATHRSLEAEVAGGRFRDDLYYRIAGWRFTLPPLRDRLEDIPELTEFFLSAFANGRPAPSLRPEVTDFLMSHSYPGNVRQLRGILQRVMLRYPGSGEITLGLIAPEDRPTDPDHASADWLRDVEQAAGRAVACGVPLKEIGRHVGDCAVRVALRTEAGNLQRAAKRLGVTDRALQIRLASKREARLLAKVDEG